MAAASVTAPPVPSYAGSCLCGSVQYRLNGEPRAKVVCHCISCKKTSGSVLMANSMYAKSQVELMQSSTLKVYKDTSPASGNVLQRSFCSECGSSLFIENPRREGILTVMTGCVDGEELMRGWRADMEIFCRSKAAWLDLEGPEGKKFEAAII